MSDNSKKSSEISKDIVSFVLSNGEHLNNKNTGECYSLHVNLPDGRPVKIFYHDYDNKGIENPSQLSELIITVIPARADQAGYRLYDKGLTGKLCRMQSFDKFDIDSHHDAWEHPSISEIDQKRYLSILSLVWSALLPSNKQS